MPISDPANLLKRIPELLSFADDAKIRRAIGTGDTFKVYRALMMARLLRRLPKQQDLIVILTSQRRLFAKALTKTPQQKKVLFLGWQFVGDSEHDTDGSHIGTHSVVMSSIPLIPLGAYVLKKHDTQDREVYSQVPLDMKGWLIKRTLALGLSSLMLAGLAYGYHQKHSQEMILLNGYDLPVLVTLDGESIKLEPQGRAAMTVRTGNIRGTASVDKAGVIDHFDHTIVSSNGTTVWNIAGAAPLLHTTVISSDTDAEVTQQNKPNVYCGQQFIELDSKLSLNKITLAKTASETGPVGIAMCIKYAAENAREKTIAPAMEVLALIYDWGLDHTVNAIAAARRVSQAEAVRVATRAMQAKPGEIPYERLYQNLREEAGEHEALLAEYAEKAKQESTSASAQFLYVSLLTGPNGVTAIQALQQRFPQDPDILQSLIWRKAIHDDYAGANNDLITLRKLSPAHADKLLDTEVLTLLAERRGIEALRLLNAAVRDKLAANRPHHAADFALVARQIRATPDFWLKTLPAKENNIDLLDFYRVRGGLRPLQSQDVQSLFIKLALALRDNPAQALAIAKTMNRHQLTYLGTDQLTLLLGETIRTNDATLYATMSGMLNLSKSKTAQLEAYMRGEMVDLDVLDIDLQIQSAAHFIRSRNTQLSTQERASLRSRAARIDFLLGPVTTALHQWPI